VLPGALWFVPALMTAGPSYAHELIWKHMIQRVAGSWQHPQPFYFYVTEASLNFLPWLPLAFPAGIRAWRRRREDRASAMLLFWVLLGVVAFSAVSGKRIAYVLPLAPAFALLVARGVEALLVERERPHLATAVVLGVLLLVLWGVGGWLIVQASLGSLVGGAVLAGLAITGLAFARRRRHLAAAWMLAATTAAGFLFRDFTEVPRQNERKSPRPVAERMDELLPPGEGEVGIYPARPAAELGEEQYAYSGAFNVYSKRLRLTPLRDADELRAFLAGPGRRLVLAGKVREIGELPPNVRREGAEGAGRGRLMFLEIRSLTPFNEKR
jgi:hypothetical protein